MYLFIFQFSLNRLFLVIAFSPYCDTGNIGKYLKNYRGYTLQALHKCLNPNLCYEIESANIFSKHNINGELILFIEHLLQGIPLPYKHRKNTVLVNNADNINVHFYLQFIPVKYVVSFRFIRFLVLKYAIF